MDYLNYYQDGMDSERQAHLSIFSSKHNLLLEQDCGIRIRGNESRSFAQKSFIDWMCTNIYIANTDTKPLGGNVYTWKSTVPDNVAYNDGK